jgi:hypothetical protein
MPTETLKTNMDTLFLPGPRVAILFLVIAEHAIQTRSRAYGPLFSVWMGIQLFVVISDACIVRNLLLSSDYASSMPGPLSNIVDFIEPLHNKLKDVCELK